jgi:methylated-DNA-protein-cysteine methyltransferase-like protein
MSDFFEQVFEVVKQIPKGRVTSYGAIASFLGAKQASRTVGYAMNASHQSDENIPAHRVVNRNGMLTGKHHFHPPESMQEKLEAEGIVVINDEVQNFQAVFWDPEELLKE